MSLNNTYTGRVSDLIDNIDNYLGDELIDVLVKDPNAPSDRWDEAVDSAFTQVDKDEGKPDILSINEPSVYRNPAKFVFSRDGTGLVYLVNTYPELEFFEVVHTFNLTKRVTVLLSLNDEDNRNLSQEERQQMIEQANVSMNDINAVLEEQRQVPLKQVYANLESHMTTHHTECRYKISRTNADEVSLFSTYQKLYPYDEYSAHELDNIIQQVINSGRSATHVLNKLYGINQISPAALEESSEEDNRRYQY